MSVDTQTGASGGCQHRAGWLVGDLGGWVVGGVSTSPLHTKLARFGSFSLASLSVTSRAIQEEGRGRGVANMDEEATVEQRCARIRGMRRPVDRL